jgi:hypothetical protein
MRILIALVTVCMLSACKLSLDATLAPLDCGDSSNQRGSSCAIGNHGSGGIVIVIGPSRQYTDAADASCYQVSPVAASVTVGESYSFQNNTSASITIQGSNQATWVTVGPGATSPALNSSAAGVYNFGVQGCSGMGGTAWYGQLSVTTN